VHRRIIEPRGYYHFGTCLGWEIQIQFILSFAYVFTKLGVGWLSNYDIFCLLKASSHGCL